MNPMSNALLHNPVVLHPPVALNVLQSGSHEAARNPVAADAARSIDQRQSRIASVNARALAAARDAAEENVVPAAVAAAAGAEQLQIGHSGPARRFDAWLHGCSVLDAPVPARVLDRPERIAEELAHQHRAVRASSYVPARTPLLLL